MKLLIALLFVTISCCATAKENIKIFTGKILSDKEDPSIVIRGVVIVQPWSYHQNIDSCNIGPNGEFKLSLEQNHRYTIIFRLLGKELYSSSMIIGGDINILVHLPLGDTGDIKIEFIDKEAYSSKLYEAGNSLIKDMVSYRDPHYDVSSWRDYRHTYDSLISINADSITVQKYLLSKLSLLSCTQVNNPLDSSLVIDLYKKISPATPLWSYVPISLFAILPYTNSFDFIDAVIESQADRWTEGWMKLYYLPMGMSRMDSIRVRSYANELVNNFGGTEIALMAKPFASRGVKDGATGLRTSKLNIGDEFPSFAFPSLDDSSKIIMNNKFKGRIYLITFWATWCPHCIEQRRYVTSTFTKYRDKGLVVVNVSLDLDINKAHTFCKNEGGIPWINAFAPDSFDNPYLKAIGIYFIPNEYLINEEGFIIGIRQDLQGEKLESTLKGLFD
jgi:thiol-disulfide isomerase/thioredoxin